MASDSLEMKVDLSDFLTAQGTLKSKEDDLVDILNRYKDIKNRASEFIEEDDSRFSNMQEAVDLEITKVEGQLKLVRKIQKRIDKVVEAMNSMEESSNRIIDKNKETIKNVLNTNVDWSSLFD